MRDQYKDKRDVREMKMETQIKTKKINYSDLIKETVILTAAVAVISAAVYFFLCRARRR